jgi:hypothetical protein
MAVATGCSLAMLRSDRAYRPEQWEVEWFAAKKPVIDAILLATAHLTKMREELDMVLKYHYDACRWIGRTRSALIAYGMPG